MHKSIKRLQQWFHDGKAVKEFQKLIDSQITCKIAPELYTHEIRVIVKKHILQENNKVYQLDWFSDKKRWTQKIYSINSIC